ncbi:ABC transporter permease [Candidatus Rhodoluna planktonica]|uniref:ABC transporter permease n=1 Tax=Candidatus Rhodoluna planktonica TaxID=535712 RepID=UPI000A07BC87|nr:ABC transporter permease [Candidatus Rhodoluna planktonica]
MSDTRSGSTAIKNSGNKTVRKLRNLGLGLVLPILVLVIWQTLSTNGSFSPTQLPQPGDIVLAAVELINRGTLLGHVAISAQRVLIGFLIGALLGIFLGSIVGLSKIAGRLLYPTVGALRAVPSLAWVPLLLIWMGIYEEPKITLIAIGAFFPVFTTVASGFKAVDRNLIEVGRSYGLRGAQLVTQILLPAASPTIFSGIRLGLAQAWLFLVAAELIASSKGLGFLLLDSQNTARTDILFLSIILLAILGKTSDWLVGLLEKRVLRWV